MTSSDESSGTVPASNSEWRAFPAQVQDQQKIGWDKCYADGSFVPVNKGGPDRQDLGGKGTKWMVLIDGTATPFAMEPEPVEIGIGPSHSDLADMVQIGDDTVTADKQTPPDHRADAQQDRFELVDGEVCGG
jgi:hypothetical protein